MAGAVPASLPEGYSNKNNYHLRKVHSVLGAAGLRRTGLGLGVAGGEAAF